MNPETILVVDDDREIRGLLSTYLEQAGFVVSAAANAAEMFSHLAIATPSLIILDVMMPGQDGVAALKELRQTRGSGRSDVPVLMLTALGEPIERTQGLEVGADDYLGKPFLPRELLARVKAILRRTGGLAGSSGDAAGNAADASSRRLRFFGHWCVDLDRQQVFAATGEELLLTGAEYRLLVAFTERPQRVLSRESLLELTHADGAESFDRSIDVLVSRLRSKMGDTAKTPKLIRTVRGGGYMFVEVVTSEKPIGTKAATNHALLTSTT